MPTRAASHFDIVCIGRAAVDLHGEQVGARLEDVQSFARHLGGSPANIASGCARLGLRTAMLTRVGDEHNGRFVRDALAEAGVDVSQIVVDPERLTALVFIGVRDRETFPLLFYRENCADMALDVDDVDAAFIARCAALLVSGTHLSTPSVRAASLKAIRAARAAGRRVVLDIDYRPELWGLGRPDAGERRFTTEDGVSRHLQGIVGLADLVVGTEAEISLAGGGGDPIDALRRLRECTDALIVMKLGARGCLLFDGPIPPRIDAAQAVAAFPVDALNVLGAGDAFMAGFLRGWVRDEPLARCAQYANACGALAISRHGCSSAMPTWPELQHFMALARAPAPPPPARAIAALEHLHHATTRRGRWSDVAIFGFDHRTLLADIAAAAGRPLGDVAHFKRLALRAALAAAPAHGGQKGIVLDDRHGADVLPLAAEAGVWIGRPVESPGSVPVQWETGADLGTALRAWPRDHVAKCVVFASPAQPPEMLDAQIARLHVLQAACLATQREWLLVLLPPPTLTLHHGGAVECMEAFYAAGLRPDWWALRGASPASWTARLTAVARHDPHCRGLLALIPDGTPASLRAHMAGIPREVRGFIGGRAIVGEPASQWMSGAIDDEAAVRAMRDRFVSLMRLWIERRLPAPQRPAPGADLP